MEPTDAGAECRDTWQEQTADKLAALYDTGRFYVGDDGLRGGLKDGHQHMSYVSKPLPGCAACGEWAIERLQCLRQLVKAYVEAHRGTDDHWSLDEETEVFAAMAREVGL